MACAPGPCAVVGGFCFGHVQASRQAGGMTALLAVLVPRTLCVPKGSHPYVVHRREQFPACWRRPEITPGVLWHAAHVRVFSTCVAHHDVTRIVTEVTTAFSGPPLPECLGDSVGTSSHGRSFPHLSRGGWVWGGGSLGTGPIGSLTLFGETYIIAWISRIPSSCDSERIGISLVLKVSNVLDIDG